MPELGRAFDHLRGCFVRTTMPRDEPRELRPPLRRHPVLLLERTRRRAHRSHLRLSLASCRVLSDRRRIEDLAAPLHVGPFELAVASRTEQDNVMAVSRLEPFGKAATERVRYDAPSDERRARSLWDTPRLYLCRSPRRVPSLLGAAADARVRFRCDEPWLGGVAEAAWGEGEADGRVAALDDACEALGHIPVQSGDGAHKRNTRQFDWGRSN